MTIMLSKLGLGALMLALPLPSPGQAPAAEPALAMASTDSTLNWGACPAFMPEGCGLAVLHGDPAKPNADVFLRIPAGLTIPHHWHTSVERMILVSGQMEVVYDGQKPTTLKAGMYAFGPAKLAHTATCAKGDDCVLFIAFEGPVDAVPTPGQ